MQIKEEMGGQTRRIAHLIVLFIARQGSLDAATIANIVDDIQAELTPSRSLRTLLGSRGKGRKKMSRLYTGRPFGLIENGEFEKGQGKHNYYKEASAGYRGKSIVKNVQTFQDIRLRPCRDPKLGYGTKFRKINCSKKELSLRPW